MKMFITTALVAVIIALGARAEIITKGGAAGLFKSPAVRASSAPAATKCGMCKSGFATLGTPASKCTVPVVSTMERPGCPGGATRIGTIGQGKAKVETAAPGCRGCSKL